MFNTAKNVPHHAEQLCLKMNTHFFNSTLASLWGHDCIVGNPSINISSFQHPVRKYRPVIESLIQIDLQIDFKMMNKSMLGIYSYNLVMCVIVSLWEQNSRKTKAPSDLILFGCGFCCP